jgi:predicted deacylase
MPNYFYKVILPAALGLILLLGLGYWLLSESPKPAPEPAPAPELVPEPPAPLPEVEPTVKIIGTSVAGRAIESYTYGTGEKTVLFVGGVHGGYEWNSSLVAYEFIAELEAKRFIVPDGITIKIIPTLNPDGHFAVTKLTGPFTAADVPTNTAHETGAGRFNENGVDLNRNFACKWQKESTWRSKVVSAGTAAFSEPEAAALRDLVVEVNPVAVIFWHSQANTVYASECEAGILPLTLTLMETYATAASYNSVTSFSAYPITGDAEGWLASIGIPAITVELESRTSAEWPRNRSGIEAIITLLK